ncbi:MAG: hypothetical protein Q7S29_01235 [Candidatus Peribacter sp.]|nr:hypothetical protein [Candidatus Peribacter sp.]
MDQLPYRGRPVTEGNENVGEVSPEDLQRLLRRLQEFRDLYKKNIAWHVGLSLREIPYPNQRTITSMLGQLRGVEPLHGAKVLYLDDGPQYYFEFLAHLTVATRRRVELIPYKGESVAEIATNIRQRLRLCPQPHLLVADENLEMLPSMEYAGHTEKGHSVIDHLRYDLLRTGVPSVLFSTDDSLSEKASSVGAAFVRKNIPPEAAVEQIADYFHSFHRRIRQEREADERFITTD